MVGSAPAPMLLFLLFPRLSHSLNGENKTFLLTTRKTSNGIYDGNVMRVEAYGPRMRATGHRTTLAKRKGNKKLHRTAAIVATSDR